MERILNNKELSNILNMNKKKKDNKDNNFTPKYSSNPLIIKPINYLYKKKVTKEKAKHNKVFKVELSLKRAKKELQHQYRLHHQLDSMPKATPQPQTKTKNNPVKNTNKATNNKKKKHKLSKQDKAKIAKANQDIQAINTNRQAIRKQDAHNILGQIGCDFGNVSKHDNKDPLKKKHNYSKNKDLPVARKKRIRNNNRPNSSNSFRHPFNNGGFSR